MPIRSLAIDDPDIAEILPEFLAEARSRREPLSRAASEGRWDEICALVHTWKGNAEPFGYPRLAELSRHVHEALLSEAARLAETLGSDPAAPADLRALLEVRHGRLPMLPLLRALMEHPVSRAAYLERIAAGPAPALVGQLRTHLDDILEDE